MGRVSFHNYDTRVILWEANFTMATIGVKTASIADYPTRWLARSLDMNNDGIPKYHVISIRAPVPNKRTTQHWWWYFSTKHERYRFPQQETNHASIVNRICWSIKLPIVKEFCYHKHMNSKGVNQEILVWSVLTIYVPGIRYCDLELVSSGRITASTTASASHLRLLCYYYYYYYY